MKKFAILISICILTITNLAGCGGDGDRGNGSNLSQIISSGSETINNSYIVDVPDIPLDPPTELNVEENLDKIANAFLALVNYDNWNEITFEDIIAFLQSNGQDDDVIAIIIDLFQQAGINQSELDALCLLASDIGAYIKALIDLVADDQFSFDKQFLTTFITDGFALINQFQTSLSATKLGSFVAILLDFYAFSESFEIAGGVNPNRNETIFLVEFFFAYLNAITSQNAEDLADLIIFFIDFIFCDDYLDFISANDKYSYRDMAKNINTYGKLIVDIADAIIPNSQMVENIIRKIFNIDPDDSYLLLTGAKSLIFSKLIGIILKDLTENDLANFFIDFDDIAKYEGDDQAAYEKKIAIPILRALKIFTNAFTKLSLKEQNDFGGWLNNAILSIKNIYDPDIYDLTALNNVTQDKILSDLYRLVSYDINNLTANQVSDVLDTISSYFDLMNPDYLPGYNYYPTYYTTFYQEDTEATMMATLNAYSINDDYYVSSVVILQVEEPSYQSFYIDCVKKVRINFTYQGQKYYYIEWFTILKTGYSQLPYFMSDQNYLYENYTVNSVKLYLMTALLDSGMTSYSVSSVEILSFTAFETAKTVGFVQVKVNFVFNKKIYWDIVNIDVYKTGYRMIYPSIPIIYDDFDNASIKVAMSEENPGYAINSVEILNYYTYQHELVAGYLTLKIYYTDNGIDYWAIIDIDVYKDGFHYLPLAISAIFTDYTTTSLAEVIQADVGEDYTITSIDIIDETTTTLKIKINFIYEGNTYWYIANFKMTVDPRTDSIIITADQVVTVTDSTWYCFTPEVSGTYKIYSFNDDLGDPFLNFYDSNLILLDYSDDVIGRNFELEIDLIAGQTYYLLVKNYFSAPCSFEAKIELL